MPLNLLMINRELRDYISTLPQREQIVVEETSSLTKKFEQFSLAPINFREKILTITSMDSGERCALPYELPFNVAIDPDYSQHLPITIIASDGSQIVPDHHAGINFAVLNLACYISSPQQTPLSETISKIINFDILGFDKIIQTEGTVNLIRDVEERNLLCEKVKLNNSKPCVCLFDGPIELWHEPRDNPSLRDYFKMYIESLKEIVSHSGILAGYIDQPRSSLIVRMIELMEIPTSRITENRLYHPYEHITDINLFKTLLKPGQRSPVFSIQSTSLHEYPDEISIHFFYLNVGKATPVIVRIEIPKIVADSPELLGVMHLKLLKETNHIPGIFYPYSLLRAHELAVVTYAEREMVISQMNSQRLVNSLPLITPSQKALAKSILRK